MKKAMVLLLALALLVPAAAGEEAYFTYVHLLDEQPIQVGEATKIPFVILTNKPSSAEQAKQADWLSRNGKSVMENDIERSTEAGFWSEEKGLFFRRSPISGRKGLPASPGMLLLRMSFIRTVCPAISVFPIPVVRGRIC